MGIILVINLPLLIAVLDAKDCVTFSYPHSYLLGRALSEGRIPLWSQVLNYPVHAESQGGYTYPPHLLLGLMAPPWLAHNLDILLHLLLAATAAYAFIRLLGLSPPSAALGALAYGLSSHFTIRLGILPFIHGGAFLPIFFLLVALYHRRGGGRWLLGLGLAFGIALLAGHFQFTVYGMMAALVFLVWGGKAESRAEFWRRVAAVVWIPLLGLLVAGVQVLPSVELALDSARGGLGDGEKLAFSWLPLQGVSFLLPQFFGQVSHPTVLLEHFGTFDNYFGVGSFFEGTYYVGIIPLLLSLLALGWLGKGKPHRRQVCFFGVLILVSFFLALGKYNPVYGLLNHLPPFSFFRHPVRFLLLACFGFSVLAGFGVRRLMEEGASPRFRLLMVVIVITAVALPVAGWVGVHYFGNWLSDAMANYFYGGGGGLSFGGAKDKALEYLSRMETAWSIYNRQLMWQIALVALTMAVIGLLGRRRKLKLGGLLLIIILVIDLGGFARGRHFFVTHQMLTENEVELSAHGENGPLVRIFSAGWELSAQESHLSSSLRIPNIPAIVGDCSLLVPRVSLLCDRSAELEEALWTAVFLPGDGSYPLRAYVPAEELPQPELLRRLGVEYLYKRVPLNKRVLGGGEELLPKDAGEIILYNFDDPWRRAFIIAGAEPEEFTELSALFDDALTPEGEVHFLEYYDELIRMQVEGPQGLLVLSDLFYPGWRAGIDGRRVEVAKIFGGMRGVEFPGGEHVVEFEFQPWTFWLGLALSLLSFGGIMVALTAGVAFGRKGKDGISPKS